MLLLKPLLVKHLTTSVIAPHGVTDLVHAIEEDNMQTLVNTYASTIASSYLLSEINMDSTLNFIFFILSVVHFRRDMPIIKDIPRYAWSFLFLQFSIMNSPTLFFIYLTFIHVPHHYRMNWSTLKKNPKMSVGIVLLTTIIIEILGKDFHTIMLNDSIMSVIKGIIMSHVIYEEIGIFPFKKIDN